MQKTNFKTYKHYIDQRKKALILLFSGVLILCFLLLFLFVDPTEIQAFNKRYAWVLYAYAVPAKFLGKWTVNISYVAIGLYCLLKGAKNYMELRRQSKIWRKYRF